ncbi:DUF1836 domain-containing protein [Clostridia bacterium]|nr:DUF1836 domain-containing protein [Clostridia bacterium]
MEKQEKKERMLTVEINELPDIDLYMDQVTGLLNDKLGHLAGEDKDSVLTKTMINNYVKSGVVEKPHKKRYGKNQMMQMILLYSLKNVMSLYQIKDFMELLKQETGQEDFEQVYALFCKVQKEVSDTWQQEWDNSDEASLDQILNWAVRADLYKRMTIQALNKRQKK